MIGLDISDHSIKVVEVTDGAPPKLRTACWSPLAPGLMRRGLVQDTEQLGNAVQTALRQCTPVPVTGEDCVVAIPEAQSFVRVLELPTMSSIETSEAIQWAIRQHIPFDPDRVYVDWQPVPRTQPDEKQQVLVGAAPRDVVDRLISVAEHAGLRVRAAELETQGIARSLLPADRTDVSGVLLVDLGATTTNVILFDRGTMRFTTSIRQGGDTLTERLVEQLHLEPNIANEKKAAIGVRSDASETDVTDTLRAAAAGLVQQIGQVIRQATRPGQTSSVRSILLAGGTANLPGIFDVFADVFAGVPIQRGNPLINVTPTGTTSALSANDAAYFTTAIGLALRGGELDGATLESREINLLSAKRQQVLTGSSLMNTAGTLLRTGVICCAGLTIAGALTWGGLLAAPRLNPPPTAQIEQAAQVAQHYQALHRAVATHTTTLETIATLGDERVPWTETVQAIRAAVPAGVTIAQYQGTSRLQDSHITEVHLTLSGQAATRSTLAAFITRLETIPTVARVTSPPANIIQSTDLRYQLEVVLTETP